MLSNYVKKCLQRMNWHGLRIDIPRTVELREKSLLEVETCRERMYELAGRRFNVASFKQMESAFGAVGGMVSFWMKSKEGRGKQKLDSLRVITKARRSGRVGIRRQF